ncbi:cytochrome c [Paraconexibacter antarcticus]|uniref:Cytochrome c n=1 Tax=Paraconexibacter antarcticus TaxID=2949664 RepID=A0ABY5DU27_9ACTN|nr:cytochrome c [Paraconexibacter antarcticus]UTI64322.1 cytochrome c [Paraconexibacter antarcticus]
MTPRALREAVALVVLVAVMSGVILVILNVGSGPATDPHAGEQTASAPPAVSTPAGGSAAPAAGTNDPALVTAGTRLYQADGCAGCHSLDGAKGVGPTFKGLDGSRVQLADGTVTAASHHYLKVSISAPDAATVKGFPKGVMAGAIASYGLKAKPAEVRALVAYIASVK